MPCKKNRIDVRLKPDEYADAVAIGKARNSAKGDRGTYNSGLATTKLTNEQIHIMGAMVEKALSVYYGVPMDRRINPNGGYPDADLYVEGIGLVDGKGINMRFNADPWAKVTLKEMEKKRGKVDAFIFGLVQLDNPLIILLGWESYACFDALGISQCDGNPSMMPLNRQLKEEQLRPL